MIVISIILFFASLGAVALIIKKLPSDCFVNYEKCRAGVWGRQPSRFGTLLKLLRTIIGTVLILLGIAMLVLPGQGLLTIVIGLMLLDFPAKEKLLRKSLSYPSVRKGLNALRRLLGEEPFIFP